MNTPLNKALILISLPLTAIFVLITGNMVDPLFLQQIGAWIFTIAVGLEGLAIWIFRDQGTHALPKEVS